MLMSLIVPCFNEEQVLPQFKKETDSVLAVLKQKYGMDAEYLFVDDGSEDHTLMYLRQFSHDDTRVRYLSFSRNFGKEAAMYAGLKESHGDYTAVMDADLQDPPELLIRMVEVLLSGEYECAAARRTSRNGEPKIRSWFAHRYYRILNHTAGTFVADGARDFRLMNRQMTDAVLSVSEYNRFSKGIFSWVGFRTKWIDYENTNRHAGKSKWNFHGLSRYAIEGLVGYTTAPLEYAAFAGILFFLLSVAGILFIIIRKLIFDDPVAGWASTIVIILFCSGIQLFCTGIIGEYLAKTYLEVKKRPVYIIMETETSRNQKEENF